jgi:outer membrane protein
MTSRSTGWLVLWMLLSLPAAGARADAARSVRLTLEQAIERARNVAPAVAAERELLAQRALEGRAARHAYLPTAGLRASETLVHNRRSDALTELHLSDATHAAGLQLDATLLDFGRRGAAVDAAEFAFEAQRHRQRMTESDVVFSVVERYLRVLADDELAIARDTNAAEQQSTVDGIQQLVDRGFRAAADLTRARAELSRALLDAQVSHDQALLDRRSLALILGLSPAETLQLVRPEPAALRVDFDAPAAVDDATRLDPERAAEWSTLQQTRAEAAAARAERYPTFALNAGADVARSDALSTLDETSLRSSPVLTTVNLQAGASLRWTMLDVTTSDRAKAAAAAARVQARRVEVVDQARELEAVATVHAARQATLLLQRAEEQYDLAELSVHQENERYRVGQGSLLQLLDAQRLLNEARLDRIQARLQRDTASARLRLLNHGGTRL